METLYGILNRIRNERDNNGYRRDEVIDIIRESIRLFSADALRFGWNNDHVSRVITAHTADIDMIQSGETISIVKYTHQGAYIIDDEQE